MKIPQPFLPIRAESHGLCHRVHVLGRDYTFGADGMITSICSQGHELLAAPIRIVIKEDGNEAAWDRNYPENESESFVQCRDDEQITLCGAMQSERFIVDTVHVVHYDGTVDIDLKLMTRGKTVAQVFGIAGTKPTRFKLDSMWLEIPLKAEACSLFHMFPNSAMKFADGSVREQQTMSMSGRIPERNVGLPFKALLWVGDEERGLGWYAESDRSWQPNDPDSAIELVRDEDKLILRLRLLDSHPEAWQGDPERGMDIYYPVSFRFGIQATPVKPFPRQPYPNNTFHVDCGIKIKGNYMDFFSAENRFDRLVEKGVTTLILHEKWNKSQNWFQLSEFTKKQLCFIVDECHKRGIKVLPYFGYEVSTMSPIWSDLSSKLTVNREDQTPLGGWWRVPFQRDYVVCYNTEYAGRFVDGIAELMDTCHIDGVYLDGTSEPRSCLNTEHGCGWHDRQGRLHGTYQVNAVRRLFRQLYEVVTSRGGEINVHSFGFINFTALPYIHQSWYGENLQFTLMKGSEQDIDLDYFRAEYIGRNMGVPVEFIVYENRPHWKFESALSCAILHGILPRPNDIAHPLELMSRVWKIFGAFPIALSDWKPYWSNEVATSHEKVKVSYYCYTALDGAKELLAFVCNISAGAIERVDVRFPEDVSNATDMMTQSPVGFSFGLEGFGCRILYVK